MALGPGVGAAGQVGVVRFLSCFAGTMLPRSKGLECAESASEILGEASASTEQMTGRQAVCPLLGNKARIPLTQCDN